MAIIPIRLTMAHSRRTTYLKFIWYRGSLSFIFTFRNISCASFLVVPTSIFCRCGFRNTRIFSILLFSVSFISITLWCKPFIFPPNLLIICEFMQSVKTCIKKVKWKLHFVDLSKTFNVENSVEKVEKSHKSRVFPHKANVETTEFSTQCGKLCLKLFVIITKVNCNL